MIGNSCNILNSILEIMCELSSWDTNCKCGENVNEITITLSLSHLE